MEKNKTHQEWLTSSQNKHPSKKTCTQKSHSFRFVREMTQLWWKYQCTRNRKWRKMCFQMSNKQRRLKVGETSKHQNIKPFALGLKRKIDLHPKVFTVKKLLSIMSLSRYVVQLHRKASEKLRNERSREIQSNCFQAGFYFEGFFFYLRFEERSLKASVLFRFFFSRIS